MVSPKIVVVTELYHPEQNSTGYFLTGIAEGLVGSEHGVTVICAQPSYNQRGVKAPREEFHNGVAIRRCCSTTFSPRNLIGRFSNFLTASLSIGWNAVLRIHKDDKILVVTNPPLLPFIVRFVCFLKRAKYVLLVHDVYPDVFVPLGIMRETNLFFRIMSWVNGRLYLSADSVVCLGRDMARLVANKAGSAENIVIIPNWGDIDAIKPTPKENNKFLKELNLTDKFVVHYSGNHGRTHDLLSLIEAADILKNQEGIHFLFIGEGGGKGGAISRAQELGLKNITFLTFVDRSELNSSLNASDISVVAFKKGMAGISVPSRLYNLMAAGKPILAVVDVDSEVAEVIREAELGVIVPPAESSLLAEQILKLKNSYKNRLRMGRKSRNEVESKYSYFVIQRQYRDLFDKL